MFVVLDSIDGGGKGKQREEIAAFLNDFNKDIALHSEEFPVHNIFYESVVHPALQEKATLNKASWLLSFLLDKTLQSDKISEYVNKENSLYLADGYLTTTFAYQCFLSEQVTEEKLLQYAEDFNIPKPDLAIYIDVDPKIAMERKSKEEGHEEGLDMNEKSLEKQERLRKIFQNMVTNQTYCKWEIVDGNGTIEEVKESILEIFRKNKIIK